MPNSPKILVVDDDPAHLKMLKAVLSEQSYTISIAGDGASALAAVEKQFYDLILMDLRMPKLNGLEAQKRIKTISPDTPIIMMTAYASVDTAVEALKAGAADYLTKPIDIDELTILVRKALHHRQLELENKYLKERLRFDFAAFIGRSPAMRNLFETLALVAPSEATTLIYGESGTGKELVANAIHQHSPRRDHPFIKLNCAALPETLLESELFGHEKGAFTGATVRKAGRFHQADQGSILLDEIAEMAPATQAKILRVLQQKEFEPVGGGNTTKVDVRVIAATNKDLQAEMEAGRFREDLFYRLNVVTLNVPPLRERGEDIARLAEHFLKVYAEKNRRLIKGIGPHALDLLMRHDWPGNVRELENTIERAVILARGHMITAAELPKSIQHASVEERILQTETVPTGKTLKDMERDMILKTLEDSDGNRTRTAETLGISRRTLQLKLKEYGINR
ncbi:MAG: sigma-54-dependent Fis family transcriptional regulator [Desulfobacteraceae bacterium]|nr:MAG: sigma-54-dependent Fis family transcriptional regulator [Desulfobacteraceae bacterium]